ncbi:hypothetical protein B9Z65_6532 [Elsinoe australis]|uniref:N-acetyltransferase domain-containing protein n=1 Tax=Elsinoe australis TaxID=40998 RepID=A0A2P8A8Z2_9PEZI|nr:hypothetical protein B9Z65_6532 [Elsinoe australis]
MPATDPSPPNLVLKPVDESNLDTYIDLANLTFSTPPAGHRLGFLDIFYPNGITPAIRAWSREGSLKAIQSDDHFYFLLRDTSLPNAPAIGCIRWQLVSKPKAPEEMDAEEEKAAKERSSENVPGVRHERFDDFRTAQFKAKRMYLANRPYLYLKAICTHPDHQRKGAGKVMMRWGLKKADELGVPMYLEASAAGQHLYEQSGFVVKGDLGYDTTKYEGVTDDFQNLAMVREPGTGEVKY